MGTGGNVARMGQDRHASRFAIRTHEGKRGLARTRCKYEDYVAVNLEKKYYTTFGLDSTG